MSSAKKRTAGDGFAALASTFQASPPAFGSRLASALSAASALGTPRIAAGPKRMSIDGETRIGSGCATPGTCADIPISTAGSSATGVSAQSPRRSSSTWRRSSGSSSHCSSSGRCVEKPTNSAEPAASGCGVKSVSVVPSSAVASSSKPSMRASSLRWAARAASLHPVSSSSRRSFSSLKPPVFRYQPLPPRW